MKISSQDAASRYWPVSPPSQFGIDRFAGLAEPGDAGAQFVDLAAAHIEIFDASSTAATFLSAAAWSMRWMRVASEGCISPKRPGCVGPSG